MGRTLARAWVQAYDDYRAEFERHAGRLGADGAVSKPERMLDDEAMSRLDELLKRHRDAELQYFDWARTAR